jgi:hypothetical protein
MSYEIMVGAERPAEAIAGYLEKEYNRDASSTVQYGNHRTRGDLRKAAIRVGTYGIPNHTVAWGRRVVNGKPKMIDGEEIGYEVDEAPYKGEIEFLKWEDKKGSAIDCRWVRGVMSIDMLYQDLRLKVKINESDDWACMISFKQGYNTFNDVSDKALIQFLKVHYSCMQSVSKSPNSSTQITYQEIRKEEIRRTKTKSIDDKVEGVALVNKASDGTDSSQKIQNLFKIVDGLEFIDEDRKSPETMYDAMKIFADQKPELFASRILEHKKGISSALSKAETYERLDLTKDGTIGWLNKGKSQPLIEGIPEKKDVMKDWVFANYYLPNVYEGLDKLKKLTDKL